MKRLLLFIFGLTAVLARASDFIPPLREGVSAMVKQPHVTAELISEVTQCTLGKPFRVALHLHADPGWHTYWINPGDAGLATRIKWTLPPGFSAGPIEWPTPELHKMGPLTTYGYAGDVYLLTTITPPDALGGYLPPHLEIKAHAGWIVCQEECIPGQGEFTVGIDFKGGLADVAIPPATQAFFRAAEARLPAKNTIWNVKAGYAPRGGISSPGQQVVVLELANKSGVAPFALGKTYFFPEQQNVIDPVQSNVSEPNASAKASSFQYVLDLQQNGEKAPQISGVLVSDRPLVGDAKAIYVAPVATDAVIPPMAWASVGHPPSVTTDAASSLAPSAKSSVTKAAPSQSGQYPRAIDGVAREEQSWILPVLGAAFLGGLILNLMPCVLPVLSLKVFSLVRHAGGDPRGAWKQGAAFTVGVVVSFWILGGLLLALRAAGNHLGWGFQMQSPGFVLGLIFLFFLLGLNLFGVFELGTSLVGLDAKATGHVGGGLPSSFLNGALATLAATPCTAPFMGSSVGFAAEQPAAVAMLVFTFLAFGMAAPYLLLTLYPAALHLVPKPGAWMEAFKQFMGFLLLATVIFLTYVFGALVGEDRLPDLLAALLVAGVAAWIYGKWATPVRSAATRTVAIALAILTLSFAIWWGSSLAQAEPPALSTVKTPLGAEDWQPWSTDAVAQALADHRPAFVDFTAAWCLSCKVNERLALDTEAVHAAFARKHVALFRADWTHADPAISAALREFHRDGVPLYLYYSPSAPKSPQVLPAVLTPGLVEDAVNGP